VIRREPALAVGAILLATAYLFWPISWALLTGGDPPWFEWDVPEQYWPDLVYVCESLHRAELPYWNPYDRGGYPFYADPQAASFHPLTWAICAVGGPRPIYGPDDPESFADVDRDGDVDLLDLSAWQRAFTGPRPRPSASPPGGEEGP